MTIKWRTLMQVDAFTTTPFTGNSAAQPQPLDA